MPETLFKELIKPWALGQVSELQTRAENKNDWERKHGLPKVTVSQQPHWPCSRARPEQPSEGRLLDTKPQASFGEEASAASLAYHAQRLRTLPQPLGMQQQEKTQGFTAGSQEPEFNLVPLPKGLRYGTPLSQPVFSSVKLADVHQLFFS